MDWPTPAAADSERVSETYVRGNPTLLGASLQVPTTSPSGDESSEPTRRLNPRFVEWLMGVPIGWVSSEPLETASFQRWSQSFYAPEVDKR